MLPYEKNNNFLLHPLKRKKSNTNKFKLRHFCSDVMHYYVCKASKHTAINTQNKHTTLFLILSHIPSLNNT